MANVAKTFPTAPGKFLYLFPHSRYGVSLADWGTATRKTATEQAAPNLGLYDVTLDDAYRYWMVFEGVTAPTDWDMYVDIIDIYDGALQSTDFSDSALAKINQHRRS